MIRKITIDWIGRNVKLLQQAKIVNGVGVPGTWYTKAFKKVLWFTSENKKSRFYYASIYHDALYWAGVTEKHRLYADKIFLKKMREENWNWFINNRSISKKVFILFGLYTIEAWLFYAAVRLGGKKAFNNVKEKGIYDVYSLI